MLQNVPFFCSFFLYLLQMRFLLCNIFCAFLLFFPLFADMFCTSFAKMCVNILFFDVYAVVSFPLFWPSVLVVGWIGQLRVVGFFHSTSFLGNKGDFLKSKGHFLQNKGLFLQNKGLFLGSLRHFLCNKIVFCRYKMNFSDGWRREECFGSVDKCEYVKFPSPSRVRVRAFGQEFYVFCCHICHTCFCNSQKISVLCCVFNTSLYDWLRAISFLGQFAG